MGFYIAVIMTKGFLPYVSSVISSFPEKPRKNVAPLILYGWKKEHNR
jgi:hypothetical protein